ncbi:hypothetical protein HRI_001765400 [Hibiscus trionum]|uniref:Uncharacterized protein n=1 Tax=Hibiscus trionum TaxID=183268 RepID=A0A9W7LYJ6_HIBTR|nr:hypothetical protein HRI_001765400 [Hibiscus trionum]
MGRAPCCDKGGVKKGPWSPEEDAKLKHFIHKHGTGGNWIALPHKAGLRRCGKSCRLRWLNYLRPNIKHGDFSEAEDRIICTLFATIGSRWSVIAANLPGRTDNDIKNYWNTKLKKKLFGIVPQTPLHIHHAGFSSLLQVQPTPSTLLHNCSNNNINQTPATSIPGLGTSYSLGFSNTTTTTCLTAASVLQSRQNRSSSDGSSCNQFSRSKDSEFNYGGARGGNGEPQIGNVDSYFYNELGDEKQKLIDSSEDIANGLLGSNYSTLDSFF